VGVPGLSNGAEQLIPLVLREAESGDEPLHCVRLWRLTSATLEVSYAAPTEAAPLGELLLGQSRVGAKCTQERAKSPRRICLPHTARSCESGLMVPVHARVASSLAY
jgi:hypothetical protein